MATPCSGWAWPTPRPGGKTTEQQAQDDNLAVMWIARAARAAVAQRQMAGLLPARRG
ncbi:MAG: hypothetical protein R3E52_00640 [Burkholderiaceae bacterium]